mmetsp:Transcript_30647/g.63966  ORF Transcript_30647/g.63966 Transcript_30647/m.63966 type:complete len:948 (+) Transcript_30647:63-2906(+)
MTTPIMKEVIQALYPPRPTASRRRVRRSSSSISTTSASAPSSSAYGTTTMTQKGSTSASAPTAASPTILMSISPSTSYGTSTPKRKGPKSRFSPLLLEYGEEHLNDWAVCASSSPLDGNSPYNNNNDNNMTSRMKETEGRLRLCSHSIVFEPRHSSRGIVRVPFRYMMGCPFLTGVGAASTYFVDNIVSNHDAIHRDNNINGNSGNDNYQNGKLISNANMGVTQVILRSERHIVMKENNVIGPFQHVQLPMEFKFTFLHSSPSVMISLTKQLYDAELQSQIATATANAISPLKKISFAPNVEFEKKSPSKSSGSNTKNNSNKVNTNATHSTGSMTPQQRKQIQIRNILGPAMERPFDPTNFLHVRERPLTPNLRCSLKTPLLSQRGCAIVTDGNFYFQPIGSCVPGAACAVGGYATGSSGKAQIWSFEDMRAIARRYDGMKDRGLEIYLAVHEGGGGGFGLSRNGGSVSGYGCDENFSSRIGNDSPYPTSHSSSADRREYTLPKSSYYSILLTFESTEVRERVLRLLSQRPTYSRSSPSSQLQLPLPCHTDRSFVESALELWQAGQLDNFEYLLVLNSAAGRSFHDLSRYPIFPWVLSNYGEQGDDDEDCDDDSIALDLNDASCFRDLTKPIGALNEERFEDFRKRYEGMVQQQKLQSQQQQQQQHQSSQRNNLHDTPFMYGTHYSSPGYVLYYLLRVMPEHMLCLQSGKFDVPDRLFHSIHDSYKSILRNPGDVKELIPEFFDPDCFDFLINSMGLQLGNLQTGERVNDVILPPWASSAKDFLRQNREALESDHCTKHLPKWIDLIFGVTSRGTRAKEARNLFHPTSYLGPADMDGMQSEEQRNQAELQATEFGIIPDQLFCKEHPGKNIRLDNQSNSGEWQNLEDIIMPDYLRQSYGVGDGNTVSRITLKQQLHGRDGLSPAREDDLSSTAGMDLHAFSHSLSVE